MRNDCVGLALPTHFVSLVCFFDIYFIDSMGFWRIDSSGDGVRDFFVGDLRGCVGFLEVLGLRTDAGDLLDCCVVFG